MPPFCKSIRFQLLLLVVISILPALAIIVFSGIERRVENIGEVQRNLDNAVYGLAREHERNVASTRHFLITLAMLPQVQNRRAEDCNRLFKSLLKENPLYANIFAADAGGKVFAGALPFKPFLIQNRKFYRDVMRTGLFAVGEYRLGVRSGRQVLPYAHPIRDIRGKITGVVVVGIDLSRYGEILEIDKIPPGAVLSLTDHRGTRLYRNPDPQSFAGAPDLPDMAAAMSDGPPRGVFTGSGGDGVRRIYAYQRFHLRPEEPVYLYMRMGVPEAYALNKVNRNLLFNLALLSVATLAALLSAWFIGRTIIAQRLERLAAAAESLGGGDLTVRTGILYREDELGRLARSFDHMAADLEAGEAEQRRIAEILRQSEERYRTILDEIEDGYHEVDLKGNFTFVNYSFCRILGYEEKELIGRNYRDFAADDEQADRVYGLYNQMFRTGTPIKRAEWDIMTKEGARRTVEFFASLMRNEAGHRTAFRGIVRDVTDRRHAEEQYRTIANSSQTGFYIIKGGRMCFANPHIPRYSGYTDDELIGTKILNFVHPEDREQVKTYAREMLAGQRTVPYEYRIIAKSGEVKWLLETVTSITYRGQQAVLGNTMEITDRKEAEEALNRALVRLHRATSSIIEVIVMAVESRDPYTAGHQKRVSALAGAIAREMGYPPEDCEAIRMAGAIHDLGKISIPAEILSMPRRLLDLEYNLIKTHADKGYQILKDIEFGRPIAEIVHQHHERLDGSGYPRGLKGDEILMEARIMAVADTVEAMGTHRPYRPSLGIEAALATIEAGRGSLYDRQVVDVCLRLFREKSYSLI